MTEMKQLVPSVLGLPALLGIAAGTPYAITVNDVRDLGPWTVSSHAPINKEEQSIRYHHTASAGSWLGTRQMQIRRMQMEAGGDLLGLPYNFIVWAGRRTRVYYLNDIDQAWPHTFSHNDDIAIAAWGNFSLDRPTKALVETMWRLADAIATMRGVQMSEYQHLDTYPTECPGGLLSPLLRR